MHEEWTDQLRDDYPNLLEVIESARNTHSEARAAYLCFMAVWLIEMRRVLKPTGSIYLHCDPTANHYSKAALDAIIGWKDFRNEVIWHYTGPKSPKVRQFNRTNDTIYRYCKGNEWVFDADAACINHHGKSQANFKEWLRCRVDSAVTKTHVHWPTDVSLLRDAGGCLLRETARLCRSHGIPGWRKEADWAAWLCKLFQGVRRWRG